MRRNNKSKQHFPREIHADERAHTTIVAYTGQSINSIKHLLATDLPSLSLMSSPTVQPLNSFSQSSNISYNPSRLDKYYHRLAQKLKLKAFLTRGTAEEA